MGANIDIKRKNDNGPTTKTSKKRLDIFSRSQIVRVVGIVWIVVLVAAAGSLTFSIFYVDATMPGTFLAGKSVASLSREELQKKIDEEITATQSREWKFSYNDTNFTATTAELGMVFDSDQTFRDIWSAGHSGGFFGDLADQFRSFQKNDHGLNFSVPGTTMEELIAEKLGDKITAPLDATLGVNENGAITFTPSKIGRKIHTRLMVADIQNALLHDTDTTLAIQTYASEARVNDNIAMLSAQELSNLLRDPFTITYKDDEWTIEPGEMQTWLTTVPARIRDSGNNTSDDVAMSLTLNNKTMPDVALTDATSGYVNTLSNSTLLRLRRLIPGAQHSVNLQDAVSFSLVGKKSLFAEDAVVLAPVLQKKSVAESFDIITEDIDVKGKNARLAFVDGKIIVKAPSSNGRTVDRDDAISKILAAVQNHTSRDIELIVTESRAAVTEDNYKKLGIKELIGTGESDFRGSHAARIHNVLTTVERFDGALIAPDEEFSFVDLLGDVDASTGYLPELVIKGKKITKEYGGGVCQVSSTVFRAAVYSGLDITERQNHSFVVSYYGQPGRDATIYIPHPDLKFINNTPGYILMQTRVVGTHLFFDFFGTSDGRTVETEGPFIYDRSAGNAMKASWTQIVKRDGKEVSRETYLSRYKPVTDFTRE